MEDFSIPSFSLGLDIDIDFTNLGETSMRESEEIEGKETLEEDQEQDFAPRQLKRLKRGPNVVGGDPTRESHLSANSVDDIEEFSSPEKDLDHCIDEYPSTRSHIASSSSKFSLMHRGFLRDNSGSKQIASKFTPASSGISTLTGLDTSNNKGIFPRITISPIRRINLIDSDSDESLVSEGKCRKNEETGVFFKKGKHFHEKCSSWEAKKSLAKKCQKESFRKDFHPMKNSKLETPALDEFCKEYFKSVKDQNVNQHKAEMMSSGFTDDLIDGNDVLNSSNNINRKVDINWDLTSPQPPAYQYFYHNDPRIQTLVHQRLPHFIPLGVKNNIEAQQIGARSLDYLNQFSPTVAEGKVQTVPEKVSRSSSGKRKNKESSDASGSWVNPRSKTTVPKDAGKRRVSADVHQSGHWFTDQDGRKVFVSKDGEKSTGRAAYRNYKKDSGGFRKARRKAAAKKSKKSRP